jgi:glycerol dehydrogenase
MEVAAAYLPGDVFAPSTRANLPVPRVFISPQRYIQGRGVLRDVGRHLSLMHARRVALLISERGARGEGAQLLESLHAAGIEAIVRTFHGECSVQEIASHVEALSGRSVECVIAAGGGKCIDAGKGVAFRLGTAVVVVPTLASNDAPCSALAVIYTREGVSSGVEFYPNSPAIVVVDTDIIAAAPERYLVAGMGDAMATWYEANVCLRNPAAVTAVGARPTLASCAIGEVCAHTLFSEGCAAAAAVAAKTVNDALETVVEANTLLSGLGFESGGLAAAHGIAQSYTGIPVVHANYLHGEMVAMGTLAQLVMESRRDEVVRVAEFFASVGLPIHLGQLSIDADNKSALDTIVEGTLAFPFTGNMPMPVTPELVRSAVLDADRLGAALATRTGDAAYRRLHAH